MENPFVKIREAVPVKIRDADPAKYPITVKCVVSCLSDKNEEILKVREFSQSMNIHFLTREYNSKKFSDDRNYVARLPAFHIYVKHGYRNTFYLNSSPCQIIHEIIQEYQAELVKRTWYTELRGYFKEKYKRNEKHIKEWI